MKSLCVHETAIENMRDERNSLARLDVYVKHWSNYRYSTYVKIPINAAESHAIRKTVFIDANWSTGEFIISILFYFFMFELEYKYLRNFFYLLLVERSQTNVKEISTKKIWKAKFHFLIFIIWQKKVQI